MASLSSILIAGGFLDLVQASLSARRSMGAYAAAMKRKGDNTAWARAMNRAIKHKRMARLHADAAYHELYGHAPHWRDALHVGDKIRTTRAGRTGRVVKTYRDGSAAIKWDNAPCPICGAHERIPRSLLIRISTEPTK